MSRLDPADDWIGNRPSARAWLAWFVTTLVLTTYTAAAFIASHSTFVDLELTPGKVIDLHLFRFFEDRLGLELRFRAEGCQRRPELGEWRTDNRQTGLLIFPRPGADVRLSASVSGSPAIIYEAMPLSSYCSDSNLRRMTSDPPIAPGTWRWPPPSEAPSLALHPGFTDVRLEVTLVEPPLVGETVGLYVPPPLAVLYYRGSVSYLSAALWFWPIFAIAQAGWGLMLAFRAGSIGALTVVFGVIGVTFIVIGTCTFPVWSRTTTAPANHAAATGR
jgi:hypothetical protein